MFDRYTLKKQKQKQKNKAQQK